MPFVVTEQMLSEARDAYHRIATGGGIAEFRDQNGETVRYSRTNLTDLRSYITWLEIQLGIAAPVGPMRVWM